MFKINVGYCFFVTPKKIEVNFFQDRNVKKIEPESFRLRGIPLPEKYKENVDVSSESPPASLIISRREGSLVETSN